MTRARNRPAERNWVGVSPELEDTGGRPPIVSRLPEAAPSFDWASNYDDDLHTAYRTVARHVYRRGRLGEFAYTAFDYINATYFKGQLPEALILWDITEYGHCLGWCRPAEDGPPIIKLHPATVCPAVTKLPFYSPEQAEKVWGYPADWFGLPFAYDVLLHECVHASVEYLLGGWGRRADFCSYWTCHNCPAWVGELNRLAPLLGYRGDPFTMRKPRRVPTDVIGKSGKPKTRTVRTQAGGAPKLAEFPHNLPGRESFYLGQKLPFPWAKRGKVCPVTGETHEG
jgi:hypothetical protein